MTLWTFNRLPTLDEASPQFIALIKDEKRRTHGGQGRYGKQYVLQFPRDRKGREEMEAACRDVERRMKDTEDSARMAKVENEIRDRQRERDEARHEHERTIRKMRKQEADFDKQSDDEQKKFRKHQKDFAKIRAKNMRPPRSPTPSSSSESDSEDGIESGSDRPAVGKPSRKRTHFDERRVRFDLDDAFEVPRPERKDGRRTSGDNTRINQALAYLAQFGITGMEISGGLLPRVEVRSRLLTSDSSTSVGRSTHGPAPEWRGTNNAIPAGYGTYSTVA